MKENRLPSAVIRMKNAFLSGAFTSADREPASQLLCSWHRQKTLY